MDKYIKIVGLCIGANNQLYGGKLYFSDTDTVKVYTAETLIYILLKAYEKKLLPEVDINLLDIDRSNVGSVDVSGFPKHMLMSYLDNAQAFEESILEHIRFNSRNMDGQYRELIYSDPQTFATAPLNQTFLLEGIQYSTGECKRKVLYSNGTTAWESIRSLETNPTGGSVSLRNYAIITREELDPQLTTKTLQKKGYKLADFNQKLHHNVIYEVIPRAELNYPKRVLSFSYKDKKMGICQQHSVLGEEKRSAQFVEVTISGVPTYYVNETYYDVGSSSDTARILGVYTYNGEIIFIDALPYKGGSLKDSQIYAVYNKFQLDPQIEGVYNAFIDVLSRNKSYMSTVYQVELSLKAEGTEVTNG